MSRRPNRLRRGMSAAAEDWVVARAPVARALARLAALVESVAVGPAMVGRDLAVLPRLVRAAYLAMGPPVSAMAAALEAMAVTAAMAGTAEVARMQPELTAEALAALADLLAALATRPPVEMGSAMAPQEEPQELAAAFHRRPRR